MRGISAVSVVQPKAGSLPLGRLAVPCALLLLLAASTAAAGDTGGAHGFSQRLFDDAAADANRTLHGAFIGQMALGTLPRCAFKYFLEQDNLYLSKYARAFAILGAKADRADEFEWMVNQSLNYLHEHGPGANRGLDEHSFEEAAAPVTVAYTSFVMQAAWGEDPILGYAAVIPCQRLYDWLFATLKATRHIPASNPYRPVIDQYADPANHRVTQALERFLDRRAAGGLAEDLIARAQYHYRTAMRYEAAFFEQALQRSSRNCPDAGAERADALGARDAAALLAPPREAATLPVGRLRTQPRILMS